MECRRVYDREWRAKNPERHAEIQRKRHLKHTYGLTPELWDQMLAAQNFACPICNIDLHGDKGPNVPFAVVDHDHDTGEIRGLLCNKCNSGLGLLGDNREGLLAALHYLDKKV